MSNKVSFDIAARVALESHKNIIYLHARALACHCECLGMNAENCLAMCAGTKVPFGNSAYCLTMQKWGLIDEKGNPTI